MTFIFISYHRVTESKDMMNSSVVKWLEVSKSFAMVDCVREMTASKSCKYGKYGLFEPFFLFFTFYVLRSSYIYSADKCALIRTYTVLCFYLVMPPL